jgi:hypothetical protein
MVQLTYKVVRRPGGWAVEYDDQVMCCFKSQEQAIAEARLLGRTHWEQGGQPSQVQVQSITGLVRTEATFGHEHRVG